MIRFYNDEIDILLRENYINNIYDNKLFNELSNLIDEENPSWIREAFSTPLIFSSNKEEKITSLSQLETKMNDIISDEPKAIMRAIRIYKMLSTALMVFGSMSAYAFTSTKVTDYMGIDKDSYFKKMLLSMIGSSIAGFVLQKIDSNFLSKIAGKICRAIYSKKCRASDQEKVRMFNELIRSIEKTINKSRNTIEKEALFNSMNKAIELRDQVSSRLHFVSKGTRPLDNSEVNQQQIDNNI